MSEHDDFAPDRQESNVLWLTIYEGMLCQRQSTPTPGYKEYVSTRESTRGKISYIREKDHLNGYITNFETKQKDAKDGSNKKYTVARVTFRSQSGKTAILEVGVKSEFVARFAMCVENMDLKKPVWFRSFMDNKGNTAIYFKQDDEKIPSSYTKENPNGLPKWIQDPITKEWDNRDYWNFLFAIIAQFVPAMKQTGATLDTLLAEQAEDGNEVDTTEQHSGVEVTTSSDDDIPF
jgi:hypothetical protein